MTAKSGKAAAKGGMIVVNVPKRGASAKKKGGTDWKTVVAVIVGVMILANYCQSQSWLDQGKLAVGAAGAAGAYGVGKGLGSRGGGGGGAAGGGGGAGAAAKEKATTTTTAAAPPVTQPPAPPAPTPTTTEPRRRITVVPTPFGQSRPPLEPLPLPAPQPIPGLAG